MAFQKASLLAVVLLGLLAAETLAAPTSSPPRSRRPARPPRKARSPPPAPISSPPPAAPCKSPAEVLADNADLSFLADVVEYAGLLPTLQQTNLSITLFAPNNDAIEELLGYLAVSNITDISPAEAQDLLLYHAISGLYTASELIATKQKPLDTLLEGAASLKVYEVADKVYVAGGVDSAAEVVETDFAACGAIIHIINSVLNPMPA